MLPHPAALAACPLYRSFAMSTGLDAPEKSIELEYATLKEKTWTVGTLTYTKPCSSCFSSGCCGATFASC